MEKRCSWVNLKNPLSIHYHDNERGKATHSDTKLFEMLILEGAQAGLSWNTILRKRENYKKAFDNFDPHKISKYDEKKINTLIQNAGIIRNKRKILSAIQNAKVFVKIQKQYGSFSKYIWSFQDFCIFYNSVQNYKNIPTQTETSKKISLDLKRRGMSFVGPTIIYSYMQAIGMVDDHENDCFYKIKEKI